MAPTACWHTLPGAPWQAERAVGKSCCLESVLLVTLYRGQAVKANEANKEMFQGQRRFPDLLGLPSPHGTSCRPTCGWQSIRAIQQAEGVAIRKAVCYALCCIQA